MYSKDNQGFQVLTTHKIQDSSKRTPVLMNSPDIKQKLQSEVKCVTCPNIDTTSHQQITQPPTKSNKNMQTESVRKEERRVPSFFLNKK